MANSSVEEHGSESTSSKHPRVDRNISRRIEDLEESGADLKAQRPSILTSSIGIPLLLLMTIFFSIYLRNFIRTNQIRFNSLNSIAQLEFKIRKSVSIFIDEFLAMYRIVIMEYYTFYLPTTSPQFLLQLKGIATFVQSSLNRVYNTTNYMGLMIDKRKNNLKSFKTLFEAYHLDRWSSDDVDYGHQNLDHYTLPIITINASIMAVKPFINTTIIPAVMNLVTQASSNLEILETVVPYMIGKEPPFNMPLPVLTKLIVTIRTQITLLWNSCPQMLSGFSYAIGMISDDILSSDSASFDIFYWSFTGVQLFSAICVLIALMSLAYMLNSQLASVTLMYQLLKVNEVDVHIDANSKALKQLRLLSFRERPLTFTSESAVNSPTVASKPIDKASVGYAKGLMIQSATQKRVSKLRFVRMFPSVKWNIATNLVVLAGMIMIMTFIGIVGIGMKSVVTTEAFYFDNYNHMRKISDNYLAFGLICSLGNFIKIDGKYPEDLWKQTSSAITDMTSFWLSNLRNLPEILNSEEVDGVQHLLFLELCSHLPTETMSDRLILGVCQRHQPSQMGILSFLKEQESVMHDYMTNSLPNQTDLMNKSKERFQSTFLDVYSFKDNYIQIRALHDGVFEVFNNMLFQGMMKVLTESIDRFSKRIVEIEVIGSLLLLSIIFGLGWKTKISFLDDKRVMLETLATIHPNTINTNPLVERAINQSFRAQF